MLFEKIKSNKLPLFPIKPPVEIIAEAITRLFKISFKKNLRLKSKGYKIKNNK